MIRHFVIVAVFVFDATFIDAQPSLLSGFQAKTTHNPSGAEIFVRWGGAGRSRESGLAAA
jgi:hypothetical protein